MLKAMTSGLLDAAIKGAIGAAVGTMVSAAIKPIAARIGRMISGTAGVGWRRLRRGCGGRDAGPPASD